MVFRGCLFHFVLMRSSADFVVEDYANIRIAVKSNFKFLLAGHCAESYNLIYLSSVVIIEILNFSSPFSKLSCFITYSILSIF